MKVSLYDVLGRRVSTGDLLLDRDGEFVTELRAPRSQGVYWAEIRRGDVRVARGIALAR